jgi:hypothetical protein
MVAFRWVLLAASAMFTLINTERDEDDAVKSVKKIQSHVRRGNEFSIVSQFGTLVTAGKQALADYQSAASKSDSVESDSVESDLQVVAPFFEKYDTLNEEKQNELVIDAGKELVRIFVRALSQNCDHCVLVTALAGQVDEIVAMEWIRIGQSIKVYWMPKADEDTEGGRHDKGTKGFREKNEKMINDYKELHGNKLHGNVQEFTAKWANNAERNGQMGADVQKIVTLGDVAGGVLEVVGGKENTANHIKVDAKQIGARADLGRNKAEQREGAYDFLLKAPLLGADVGFKIKNAN